MDPDEYLAQLFPPKEGVDDILTNNIELNDEYEKKWENKVVHGKKSPWSTLHFENVTLANDRDFGTHQWTKLLNPFTFHYPQEPGNDELQTWVSGNSLQPGHIALRAFTGRSVIAWREFEFMTMASGNIPGAFPLPGPAFDIARITLANGNYNNSSITINGHDADGNIIVTQSDTLSADTPKTIKLIGFTGIHQFNIVRTTQGTLHPSAVGVHDYIAVAEIKYKYT